MKGGGCWRRGIISNISCLRLPEAASALWRKYMKPVVQSGLISNCGEFAIIKSGIIQFLPYSQIFKGISVSQPVSYKEITVFGFKHITRFSLQSPTQSFKERLLLYYSCHYPGKKPKDAAKEAVYPISASPSSSPAPGIQSVISEVTSTPVRFTFTLKV